MELINGKFYKGDKEVPLEIGNKEQIKLLKEAFKKEEELEEMMELGTPVEAYIAIETITYDVEVNYKCECGKYIHFSDQIEDCLDEDEAIKMFSKRVLMLQRNFNRTCKGCNTKYQLKNLNEDLYVIKL